MFLVALKYGFVAISWVVVVVVVVVVIYGNSHIK